MEAALGSAAFDAADAGAAAAARRSGSGLPWLPGATRGGYQHRPHEQMQSQTRHD